MNTKERLLTAINTVLPLNDYNSNDCIFSDKYPMSAVDMVYILKRLALEFRFTIDDAFVDALEMCTFQQLESILARYDGTDDKTEKVCSA